MKTTIVSRKIELTDVMEAYINKKLAKLDKFFGDEADAKITITVEKERQKIEATIHSHNTIFRVEEVTDDMYKTMDKIIDAIERKIRKHKTKLEKRYRHPSIDSLVPHDDYSDVVEEKEFNIVKTKLIMTKPMSAEEAILEMNLLGHGFFIFKNDKTFGTNLVYKRKDGDYSLIEVN